MTNIIYNVDDKNTKQNVFLIIHSLHYGVVVLLSSQINSICLKDKNKYCIGQVQQRKMLYNFLYSKSN